VFGHPETFLSKIVFIVDEIMINHWYPKYYRKLCNKTSHLTCFQEVSHTAVTMAFWNMGRILLLQRRTPKKSVRKPTLVGFEI
jgi:hypothetical protein